MSRNIIRKVCSYFKAAAISTEKVVEIMKLTKRQIEVTMFAVAQGELEIGKLAER